MATNEILQFASQDTGSNLLTQAEYDGDAQRIIGHQPGIARSRLENKVLRQTSLMAAGLAQFMAANQSGDITDGLSAQDIADALNLSLENKIASIGTGGITILQSSPIAGNTGFDAINHMASVLELKTASGESVIAGAFMYQLSTNSQYQQNPAMNNIIGINITGATKTSGKAIYATIPFTYSKPNLATEITFSPIFGFSNSTIRIGHCVGRTVETSFYFTVGAVFFAF